MTKIFISHSDKDSEFSLQLAQALRDRGVDTWIDKLDILASEKWNMAIQRGLKTCDVMIVVITPESMVSENVTEEWLYFHTRKQKIFTVLWKPTEDIHFQLEPIQRVDFHGQEFAGAFETFCAQLKRNGITVSVADRATPPPTPPRIQGGAQTLPRVEDILPPPFEWCEIPAGKVTLEDASDYDGTIDGSYTIDAFAIAKYPITNAQYQVFVDALDGYADVRWWYYSEEAEAWRNANPQPDEIFYSGNERPRTNVSWYESMAFCRWLSAKTKQQIILPTEQQWQRAAQGDDGRMYPWGSEWDCKRCNNSVSPCRSYQTTPVRQYEGKDKGDSFFDVVDMAGNVWEWCLTEWGTDDVHRYGYNNRVVRGMPFGGNNRLDFRASLRNLKSPNVRDIELGFRSARSS